MTDTDPVFRQAFEEWRRARPAWVALVKAIREERPREEIDLLAAPAGVDRQELLDLISQHLGGKAHLEDASRIDNARKRAKEARDRLERAEKRRDEPGLSLNQQQEIMAEVDCARIVAEANEQSISGLEVSRQFVDHAKAVGVL